MGSPLRPLAEQTIHAAWPRAFVRCDRGGGLYVTNAPLREEDVRTLNEAGFLAERMENTWRLSPGGAAVRLVREWLSPEQDPLRLPALEEVLPEDTALFIEGLKRLELPADDAALSEYEKRLRRRAAECMRTHRGGGLLTECGRLLLIIRRERTQ